MVKNLFNLIFNTNFGLSVSGFIGKQDSLTS